MINLHNYPITDLQAETAIGSLLNSWKSAVRSSDKLEISKIVGKMFDLLVKAGKGKIENGDMYILENKKWKIVVTTLDIIDWYYARMNIIESRRIIARKLKTLGESISVLPKTQVKYSDEW